MLLIAPGIGSIPSCRGSSMDLTLALLLLCVVILLRCGCYMQGLSLGFEVGRCSAWFGLSAFLAFACVFRKRIQVLVANRLINVLIEYEPPGNWGDLTSKATPSRAIAIGCIIENDGSCGTSLRLPVDEAESVRINHWVRCIEMPAPAGGDPVGDCSEDAYMSSHRWPDAQVGATIR